MVKRVDPYSLYGSVEIILVPAGTEFYDFFTDRTLTVDDETAVMQGNRMYVTEAHFKLLQTRLS